VLLRPGQVSADAIEAVIGVRPQGADAAAPRASGTLESHYAPHTPVAMQDAAALHDTIARLTQAGRKIALIHLSGFGPVHAGLRLPLDPDGFAYALYAALREMDSLGADIILVEAPPRDAAWLGVNDRLRRAAHGSHGIVHGLLNSAV
jgi:L-threonylcarbamoyladenylate synthase